jgi:hypothetical protein
MNEYHRLDIDMTFYRTESGVEVDCVLQFPTGDIWAVEIKSTRNPSISHCKGLRSFKEDFPQAQSILACRAARAVVLGPFTALPWQELLEKIFARRT